MWELYHKEVSFVGLEVLEQVDMRHFALAERAGFTML